jgi:hypothetical protein
LLASVAAAAIASGCTGVLGATEDFLGGPFKAAGLPPMKGQVATCTGPREKTFSLEAREETVDLGMGIKLAAWTYNGGCPDRSSKRAKATPSRLS